MIVLDLSRLLSRAGSATPSGIDRVELAYAQRLLGGARPHGFAALDAIRRIGALPQAEAQQFVGLLAAGWRDGATAEERSRTTALARRLRRAALFGGGRRLRAEAGNGGRPVYLLVSHHHLERQRAIARLKAATGARFVCFVHDLIPLDFPAVTRPQQTRRHRRRIATAAALADAVVVNSAATATALTLHLGRQTPVTVASLGLDIAEAVPPGGPPYFVCVGTVETRKNQALLLDLWRDLAGELGDATPRLLLIGRRGWGSAALTGRLAGMRGLVVEYPALPDSAVARLLCGARALLLPSLAEGFGLPVIEALALGVPVVCSDLPALRESGGGVPDHLGPGDRTAWRAAIVDYLTDSPRRQAQLARLAGWRPPRWDDHFAILDRIVDDLM